MTSIPNFVRMVRGITRWGLVGFGSRIIGWILQVIPGAYLCFKMGFGGVMQIEDGVGLPNKMFPETKVWPWLRGFQERVEEIPASLPLELARDLREHWQHPRIVVHQASDGEFIQAGG
jgi:hypothetical protein